MQQQQLLLLLLAGTWILVHHHQAQLAAAQDVFEKYPLDWSLVGANPAASTNITASCICALLNDKCTPNCCCDAACPAAAVEAFKAAGSCLPEGPPPEQLDYCQPAESFAKVNLPTGDFYYLQQATASADFLTQLLCIAADHNPSMGLSYPDPPVGDVGTNAQEVACQAPAAAAAAAATTAASSNSYSYGQAVMVVAPAGGGGGTARGAFTLPAAAVSAECLDVQQVGFMQRVPASLKAQESSCQLTVSSAANLAALCSSSNGSSSSSPSLLSPTLYTSLQFPAAPASSTLHPVAVTSLSRLDPVTGALLPLDPDTDLAAPAAVTGPPQACNGVVVAAHFLFRYSLIDDSSASAGIQLAGVTLSLVIADVALPVSGLPLVFDTAFSVSWANTSAAAVALQPFSGAPGYLPGFPLLAGLALLDPNSTVVSSTADTTTAAAAARAAVARFTHGLQLPGAAPDGRCSANVMHSRSVAFGYNASSTCSIQLTLPQLRLFCQSNDPTKYVKDLLGGLLQELLDEKVVVGIWGNADPSNINQWLALHPSNWPVSLDTHWDEASATCSNFLTGFDIRLLTGVAYTSNNLQSKVLYAQLCFHYGSWTFSRLVGPGIQSFTLNFTASFVPKANQVPTLQLKPAPPLFAPLPPDLFYPFLTNGGGAAELPAQRMGLQQVLLLLAMGVLSQLAVTLLSQC